MGALSVMGVYTLDGDASLMEGMFTLKERTILPNSFAVKRLQSL